jgi:hypothetical protein
MLASEWRAQVLVSASVVRASASVVRASVRLAPESGSVLVSASESAD